MANMYGFYDPSNGYGHSNNKNKYLYGGQSGRFQAQANPSQYFNYALGRMGVNTSGNDPFSSWLQNQGFKLLQQGYEQAQGDNRNLGWMNYLKRELGVPMGAGGQGQRTLDPATIDPLRRFYLNQTPEQRGETISGYGYSPARWSAFG